LARVDKLHLGPKTSTEIGRFLRDLRSSSCRR